MYALGQILTFLSYLVFWSSRFFKDKRRMLWYDNVSRILAILAFLSLGTMDGIKNTIFVVIRNSISSKVEGSKRKVKVRYFALMLLVLLSTYIFSYNGASTISIAICGVLNLYGTVVCDEQGMRLYGLSGSIFYAMFLFLTKNYVGFICEVICAIVLVISYQKYKVKFKEEN